jgi:hypothetical protein
MDLKRLLQLSFNFLPNMISSTAIKVYAEMGKTYSMHEDREKFTSNPCHKI